MLLIEKKRIFKHFIFSSFNENNRSSSSSFNEYFRQGNPSQQSNQSSLRSNRIENTASLGVRERQNEQNVSRRSGNKPGPIETTSTSPIPQRSKQVNEDNIQQQQKRNRNFDQSTSKREERQSGIQEQSPWNQGDSKSS
jgi:hypothetical protein